MPEELNVTEQEWAERLARLREAEWRTSKRLVALAEEIIKRAEAAIEEQKVTIKDGVSLMSDASKFGRLAVEGIEEPPKSIDLRDQYAKELNASLGAVYPKEAQP